MSSCRPFLGWLSPNPNNSNNASNVNSDGNANNNNNVNNDNGVRPRLVSKRMLRHLGQAQVSLRDEKTDPRGQKREGSALPGRESDEPAVGRK